MKRHTLHIRRPFRPGKYVYNNHGFSLLELIAALVLLGLLAAIFGMGLVAAMQSHEISRANVRLTQKSQPAITRMTRELMELIQIEDQADSGAHPYILYRRLPDDSNQAIRCAIHFNSADNTLLLYTAFGGTPPLDESTAAQGDLLVDGVSNLTLNYFEGADVWNGDLHRLSHIEIALELFRPGRPDATKEFRTTVHLRNTNNFGGAAPTSRPASIDNYSCFLSNLWNGR